MDPFEKLSAKDGFHVVLVEFGHMLTVSCVAYAGGEPANMAAYTDPNAVASAAVVEILEYYDPTPAQAGQAARLQLVLDSVARYLTTGGDWEELVAAMQKMRKVAVGGLAFPGYHLLESYSTTEGTYQHVFVKSGTKAAVLWEEPTYTDAGGMVGGFIDRTTLEEIREQQENDESIWSGGPREEEEEEAGPAAENGLLQLPAGPGSSPSEEAP